MLMPELPGEDQYDATRPVLDRMIDALVAIQAAEADDVEDAAGARPARLARAGADRGHRRALVDRRGPELDTPDRDGRSCTFAAGLPARFDDGGGVWPAGHAGPRRLPPGQRPGCRRAGSILLDWGDCGVGQPLLDEPAFLHLRPELAEGLRAHWHAGWRERVPGSDPDRASRLLRPVAAARQALIYQMFLDGIEASEQPYHRHDVPDWLRRTAALARAETGPKA